MAELVPFEPFDIVIFGATGDLALRKLVPALFHRWDDGQIPESSQIIAASRDDLEQDAFRTLAARHIQADHGDRPAQWYGFARRFTYVSLDSAERGVPSVPGLGEAISLDESEKVRA